jgi:osmoprotectant transport system substrate-binding protein
MPRVGPPPHERCRSDYGCRMLRARARVAATVLICLPLTLIGCGRESGPPVTSVLDDDTITVGSFNFPESEVIAEIYAQALEGRGFHVDRQLDVGPRELLIPALQRGLVELVPEYAGSLLGFFGGTASSDSATTHERLAVALAPRGLTALSAAPAEDRNAFAISATTAKRLNVESLSDLTSFAPGMSFGGPTECPDRPLCLKGLEDVYGLHFKEFIALDTGGPLTVQALNDGTVDVGLLFSSDPTLRAGRLIDLRDDRELQPSENVTPVISQATLERLGPGIADALNAVSALLRTADLRELNAAIGAGRSAAEVAHDWLQANGFEVPPE